VFRYGPGAAGRWSGRAWAHPFALPWPTV